MELFNNDGHLTNEGIMAIIAEELSEMQSLEAAEHLSFCDDCLLRYTMQLEGNKLYTPETPLLPPVKARLRQKVLHVVFSKYATAAAAVGFAFILWGTGVFTSIIPPKAGVQAPQNNLTQSISGAIGGFFVSRDDTVKIPDAIIKSSEREMKAPKNNVEPKQAAAINQDKQEPQPPLPTATDTVNIPKTDTKLENTAKTDAIKENPAKQEAQKQNLAKPVNN